MDFTSTLDSVYVGIGVLFVLTQILYFTGNITVLSLLLTPSKSVSRATADREPPMQVLLPAYAEPRELIERTLECIQSTDYPTDRLHVYVVYEEDDDVLASYIDELAADWAIEPVPVRQSAPVWDRIEDRWHDGEAFPANKARALTYALHVLDFDPDDVVTVFDADTLFEPHLFQLAVTGLETHDIVQAKQTVRNIDDGWLPLLESTGVTAWSCNVYERLTGRPYQLLGKGYFTRAETLYRLDGWNPYSITEDMELGIRAYKHGCSLGILDTYVQDICPAAYDDWITQKTRWANGPYEVLANSMLSGYDRLQFVGTMFLNQMISVLNVVGIPIGLIEFYLYLTGSGHAFPAVVRMMVLFNLLSWVFYTYKALDATSSTQSFDSAWDRLRYHLRSNIVTQTLYATVWTVPILLALRSHLAEDDLSFEVTPK
ncbi:glycosyltransferase [Halorubellus sp. JP-L1]|uniref:glycosyltransferase family 2 protein n=1 Tax=Halorubellus sp. JP-L1 TaxID=2715753 RepID=UPI00140E635A|nr:glycosyltransferase family 2 protein [Halorubellus sp. JP-L1]NHN42162.1 glycosyltransferase [Halorubellus sp. JP-L1]